LRHRGMLRLGGVIRLLTIFKLWKIWIL